MSDRTQDARAYILAATICRTADLSIVRQEVAGLRLKGQQKLHWRDESDKRRRQIAEFIALLPLEHVVVVRNGHPDDRPERRRRHAMERLLHELDQAGIRDVAFESRGSHNDNRDRDMLDALRARKTVSPGLRMRHVGGRDDAMLWVPDALCGVTVKQRTGDRTYLEAISAVDYPDYWDLAEELVLIYAKPGPCRPAGIPGSLPAPPQWSGYNDNVTGAG